MPLIKSHEAARITHAALVLDLGDLRQQAQQILARARAEADQILTEARVQGEEQAARLAEEARKAGLEEGRREGLEVGRREGHQQALRENGDRLKQLEANWLKALENWEQQRETLLSDARHGLLELSVDLARRIVLRMPEVRKDLVVDQVERAVAEVSDPGRLRIRVHPEDRSVLAEALPGLCERVPALNQVEWVEDEKVGRGGCVLEHGSGRVDATLARQLDRIACGLLGIEDLAGGGEA